MNITIIGCGKSGLAAARLGVHLGYNVRLTESKDIDKFQYEYLELKNLGVKCEFGLNSFKFFENCDLVVTSPGIPPDNKLIKKLESKNYEIISELEFAYRYCKGKIIAITGTNGKTTTTALIAHILNYAGKRAIACGNIGYAFSKAVMKNINSDDIFVVEASSFQLDRINSFAPDVAIILNITPDHLDYHKTFENYINAKFKITSFQKENNLLILNYDDDTIKNNLFKTSSKINYFSLNRVEWGLYVKDNEIIFKNADKEEIIMHTSKLGLAGVHNLYNSMAAILAARAFEIRNEDIRDSLMSFKGVEHRLEKVREINEVLFINDSKATNVNSTYFALSSYHNPIIWIAGGRAKDNDYSILDELVAKNVKLIVLIGEEKDNIFNHFCLSKTCLKADSLEEAVNIAYENATENDIVLFCPACKSFDMFLNFEDRGEKFKDIVNNL